MTAKLSTAKIALWGLLTVAFAAGNLSHAAPLPTAPNDAVAKSVDKLVKQLKKAPRPKPPKEGGLDNGFYLMDLAKGEVTPIDPGTNENWEHSYCGSLGWSNDGTQIFFDITPGLGNWAETRIQSIELTDAGLQRGDYGLGNCPTLSPDGKQLAYLLNVGMERGIHIKKSNGADDRFLKIYGSPKWSPDGKSLLVMDFNSPPGLSVVDVADNSVRKIESPNHKIYSYPSWAGNDTLSAYVRLDKGVFGMVLLDIKNPAEAKLKETLWKRGDGLPPALEPTIPIYSPDTKRGAFVGRDPEGQRLFKFELGKVPVQLEPGRAPSPKITTPALSPDGRYLLFCDHRSE